MFRYLFLILLVVSTSCTSSESVTNTSTKNKEGPGSFFTGRSEQGISLSDITGETKINLLGYL